MLVAIAANPSDGAVTRTAIFAEGEDVRLLKEGDTIGRFVVRTITATSADLFDPIANRTHRTRSQVAGAPHCLRTSYFS